MIIKRPVVTEKTAKEYEESKKVTFEVDLRTTKVKAAKALEEIYGVTVVDSWVINRLGKKGSDRLTRKPIQKKKDKKLVKFQLSEKDSIDIFKI